MNKLLATQKQKVITGPPTHGVGATD